jgi:hypothetical protein
VIVLFFNIATCITALLAAVFWFMSGFAKVSREEAHRRALARANANDGWIDASITIDGADLAETQKLQSNWNRVAALTAGVSALCQSISVASSMILQP